MGTVTNITEAIAKRDQKIVFQRGDHVELADKLVESLTRSGSTTAVHADGQVWQYDEQEHVYSAIDPRVLRRMVHQYAGAMVLSGKDAKPLKISAGVVSGVITVANDQLYQEDFFGNAVPGLTFANGFMAVTPEGTKLLRHSSSHKARFSYPFEFDPDATPNRFLQFLAQVFRDDADADEKIKLLQEYVGASMFGLATKYQRILIMYGQGSNGKSVFQQIVAAAMPTGSVCNVTPQQFRDDYRRAMLAGKLLNIVTELPEAAIMDSESFKSIVAGDPTTAREIFKSPFTFRPVAGHLCSANRLPVSRDQSHGFWRRMLLIGFNRTFTADEQNPHLADDLLHDELPTIVSWFVAGAQRVQLQGGYTIPESHQAALDQWRHDADPVRSFVEQKCDRRPAGNEAPMMPSRLVYAGYRQWCLENGHRPIAINRFGQRMSDLGIGPEHKMNGSYYPFGFRA